MDLEFFVAGLVSDWVFRGEGGVVFGNFGVFCCFVFGFVLGFIFSKEAHISFNGSSVLCFDGISSELFC